MDFLLNVMCLENMIEFDDKWTGDNKSMVPCLLLYIFQKWLEGWGKGVIRLIFQIMSTPHPASRKVAEFNSLFSDKIGLMNLLFISGWL